MSKVVILAVAAVVLVAPLSLFGAFSIGPFGPVGVAWVSAFVASATVALIYENTSGKED